MNLKYCFVNINSNGTPLSHWSFLPHKYKRMFVLFF